MNNANPNANDTVDTVDRVLACLRDIEAPAGMDRRILAALHERAETNTSTERSSITSPLLWLAATAATIVAVTLWWRTPSHPTPDLAIHTQTTTTLSTAQKAADPSMARSEIICQSNKAGCPIHDAKRHGWDHSSEARTAAQEPAPLATPLPDTVAASHPAPPLPLTQQEQLLLRIVHKGDPIELASLNNDFRDRQPLRDAEDFQRFFKPPAAPHPAEAQPTAADQSAQQTQPNIEAQPAPEPPANDIPQQ
jgi:hypothetical protein